MTKRRKRRFQNPLKLSRIQKKSLHKKRFTKRFQYTVFFCVILMLLVIRWAQPTPAPVITDETSFFEAMAPAAQRIGNQYGLFPSVILAQAALESDFGRSGLARDYHNYFGVKGSSRHKSVYLPTQEFINGQWLTKEEPFRIYRNSEDALKDYARLITGLSRYQPVVQAESPEQAAVALYQGGYATDPVYAEKVIDLIHTYQLKKYDNK